jgi:hypothetical protein
MSIDEITFPVARRALTREVLLDALEPEPVRARRVRTPTIVAIVVGALTIPAAATAYYAFREVDNTDTIRCFTEASLDGDGIYLSMTDDPTGQLAQIADPIGACGDLWSQGVLLQGVLDAQPPTPEADLPVPELAACVIEYGDREVVAVIPGEPTVCAELGLARWAQ